MRLYEIQTEKQGTYKIECDEIVFNNNFFRQTFAEPLCLFQGKKLVAIFRAWMNVVDITDKEKN